MTTFGFLLATCFIPAWTGAAIPTGWVLLSCTLPFLLWRRVELSYEHALGAAFLGYVALSLIWAPVREQGIWDLWNLSILAAAFVFGAVQANSSKLYTGLAIGVGISTIFAIAQLYWDWQGLFQFYRPAGLFVNPGVYGEICALVLIALIASRCYWSTLAVAPGIYLSGSRTAVLACVAAALVATWDHFPALGANRSRLWKNPAVLSTALVLVLGSALVVRSTLIREPNWWTSPAERLIIWQDTIQGLTLIGRGAGSFLITYPAFANHADTMATRPEHAHSDILELIYDYGFGVAPLALLVVLALRSSVAPERYILIGFLTLCAISFPMRIPILGFLGAFALGRLCSARALVRVNSSARGQAEPLGQRGGEHAMA